MSLRNVVCAFAVLSLAVCKKQDESASVTPDDASASAGEEAVAEPKPVPQIADPPELAELRAQYLRGEYQQVEQQARPLAEQWSQPDQVRASSFASSWQALAAAESMPDAAKSAVELALNKAQELEDSEAEQLALIARGVYLMRVAEPAKAQADLDRAVEVGGASANTGLATLFRAEAILNQAYGPDERLAHPEKLAAAREAYNAIVGAEQEPMLKARALEGLAAIAKETGEKDELCQRAGEAATMYEANAAAEFLRQGPALLASEAGCAP